MDAKPPLQRKRLRGFLLVLLALFLPTRLLGAADENMKQAGVPSRLDFYGEIRIGNEQKSKVAYAFIGLTGNSSPYASGLWTDYSGKFRFRNLEPGFYTLVAEVNRRSEQRITLEILPTLADAHGRITKTILLNPNSFHSLRKKPQIVSWMELSIPAKARNEYAQADNALAKGQLEVAIQHFQKAVQLAPQFISALNRLGTIYYFQKKYEMAEDMFRQALAKDPKSYEPLVNLGETLLVGGKPEEALTYTLRASQAQTNDASANALVGLNYVALHEDDQAVGYLIRAKEIDPMHYSQPQLVLAGIYERKSQSSSALHELEEFVRLHPASSETPRILKQMVQLRRETGE